MLLPETVPDPLVPAQVFHLWVPQCPVFTLVTSVNTLGLPSWLYHRLSCLMVLFCFCVLQAPCDVH